jgi:hypothetical protein
MKKTLLFIALFIASSNANAQSNATLEETYDWLRTFGSELIEKKVSIQIL